LAASSLFERGLATAQGETAAEMQFLLGEALQDQGKLQEAATAFLKVAVLHGESAWAAEAQLRAGRVLEMAGEAARAREVYRALLERYAESKPAQEAKQRLAALGG
jgi:TolA-binding protein